MVRVAVNPNMLRWARERSGRDPAELARRFPNLSAWEAQEAQPTLNQLQQYARATFTPIGFLFLQAPPEEPVPIPDFRTMADRQVARPTPNLLETIYICQQRQSWYREYAQLHALPALNFVGSATIRSTVEATAEQIRRRLGFDLESRRKVATWEAALRQLIGQADAAGIMVMCSGVVGNNNYRRLDPKEFRGFALSDAFAPLVFINGRDTKSAQMFTLAHEIAHLWLGQSALTDADASDSNPAAIERWCNAVAAETLVPMRSFRTELREGELIATATARLSRHFKVSSLVILRRLFDAGQIPTEGYWTLYRAEVQRLIALQTDGDGGGNFYLSQAARVSKRFARALVGSTLEGSTLYRDAMRMVGVAKVGTFHELGRSLGMPV